MAKITVCLRYYKNSDGEQQVSIRVSHLGKTKYIPTGISVQARYFKNEKITSGVNSHPRINSVIQSKVESLWNRVYKLENLGSFTIDDIINDEANDDVNFFNFAYSYNEQFLMSDSPNSYRNNRTTIKKLQLFAKRELRFEDFTYTFLDRYTKYLFQLGNKASTINSNLKFIQRVWNRAYKQGIHEVHRSPFKLVKLKHTKQNREALTEYEINKLMTLPLKNGTWKSLLRDMFVASFYLGGIRFADFCTLSKFDISEGRLNYTMKKTGKEMSIPLVDGVLNLIEKYSDDRESLLFPLLEDKHLKRNKASLFAIISSKNTLINKSLKKVAKDCGIEKNLTFHISRHSFADISRKKELTIYDISKMLGHSSISITEMYLSQNDQKSLDKAFKTVLSKD